MNTRNALIDVLANRCKDRAGKPEGAVENAGTSDGAKKGWKKRGTHLGWDILHRTVPTRFGVLHQAKIDTDEPSVGEPKAFKTHDEAIKHAKKTAEFFGSKNCTARDVIADRKAKNSTMLAQFSPSPMIGSYAEGKRRAKNSGTSEGVKKGWEKRRGKEFQHPGTGKMYHFNEETGLWHDRKGEPTRMSGIISHLEKQAKNSGKGSDSVRWAREFLRKSRAQPGKPKVDSTKWAREALVALKSHKPVTNDHRGDALEAGIQVELEHGPDRALAEKIARDHLREDPEYYAKLKRCGVK